MKQQEHYIKDGEQRLKLAKEQENSRQLLEEARQCFETALAHNQQSFLARYRLRHVNSLLDPKPQKKNEKDSPESQSWLRYAIRESLTKGASDRRSSV